MITETDKPGVLSTLPLERGETGPKARTTIMKPNHCQNCGIKFDTLALWAERKVYRLLVAPSDGAGLSVNAVLITDCPENELEEIAKTVKHLQPLDRCFAFETALHSLGHFAIVAKWEERLLL